MSGAPQIKNAKSLNMGYTSTGVFATIQFVRDYILNHSPQIKLIGINIPFSLFSTPTGDAVPWESIIGTSAGYAYDKNHNFWKSNLPPGFLKTIKNSIYPNLEASGWDSLGLKHVECGGWGDPNPDIDGPIGWTVEDPNYRKNYQALVELIDTLTAHKIHLLGINFPESPAYKNTAAYLKGGPTWETGHAIFAQMKELESKKPYFHIYDAYKDGNHDYVNRDFLNSNHLCPVGAAKLSKRVDSVITSILKR